MRSTELWLEGAEMKTSMRGGADRQQQQRAV